MSDTKHVSSRREVLKKSSQVAAATTLASLAVPHVHAAENNTLQVALIGCGGRGTGAAADALAVKQGPLKLVAMADVFEGRVRGSYDQLSKKFRRARSTCRRTVSSSVSTPTKRRWTASSRATSRSSPRRWPSAGCISRYAIEKGLNVFMEKPVTADGPTSRRMLDLGEGGGGQEPQGRRRA